jgi:hypothetical protein
MLAAGCAHTAPNFTGADFKDLLSFDRLNSDSTADEVLLPVVLTVTSRNPIEATVRAREVRVAEDVDGAEKVLAKGQVVKELRVKTSQSMLEVELALERQSLDPGLLREILAGKAHLRCSTVSQVGSARFQGEVDLPITAPDGTDLPIHLTDVTSVDLSFVEGQGVRATTKLAGVNKTSHESSCTGTLSLQGKNGGATLAELKPTQPLALAAGDEAEVSVEGVLAPKNQGEAPFDAIEQSKGLDVHFVGDCALGGLRQDVSLTASADLGATGAKLHVAPPGDDVFKNVFPVQDLASDVLNAALHEANSRKLVLPIHIVNPVPGRTTYHLTSLKVLGPRRSKKGVPMDPERLPLFSGTGDSVTLGFGEAGEVHVSGAKTDDLIRAMAIVETSGIKDGLVQYSVEVNAPLLGSKTIESEASARLTTGAGAGAAPKTEPKKEDGQ